ncbi:MAG: tRNA pseudouridine(38-40) synthase TruA [Lachnospiraceae bacterium]|nr:tRNA pseudouridine(38-40) synthase TruA [Lachnospiraceae bacterium]
MKRNIRFTICYDGTRYSGWERQKNTDATIQGKLEAVLSRLCEEPVTIIGAGRTDAGVHAREMTANALVSVSMSCGQIRDYMNTWLPEDICVLDAAEAGPRFHSRFNASGKTYCYTCYIGAAKPVFDRKYVTCLDQLPDVEAMRQAAEFLTGTHDFASFCGNPKMKKSTVRTIDSITITQKGDYLRFSFHGDGFLQNMVRILVGTLLETGFGKRLPDEMKSVLEAKNRALAGFMAPAQGLCLIAVDYN